MKFKQFVLLKEAGTTTDWRSEALTTQLDKGFIPPPKMRPIIKAFLNSDKIVLQKDTGPKSVTMPKKSLYLVGGPVRDFIKGKSIKDYDLATNATPEQIALILSNAGFKRAGDRSGKTGTPLSLPEVFWNDESDKPTKVQDASGDDSRVWFIKGRDNSDERKPFVISAVVDGEEFEIATFRKDAKVTDGAAAVDFVDNPKHDADRRDLTYNALYIELTKPDAENKTLIDPTRQGMTDLEQGRTRTVGKAEDRFNEDPLRIMRAIRFHCRFSQNQELDKDILKALPKFMNLAERVALERIRDEFLKGLLHPDIDPRCYLSIYKKTGLLNVIFPGLVFDPPNGVPTEFTDKQDKALSLAWLLQHNPVDKVTQALAPERTVGDASKPTGWQVEERKAVVFLLRLKDFSPDKVVDFYRSREGTGLSNQQIRDWVDMFKRKGTNQDRRPWWAKHVRAFADFNRSVKWPDVQAAGLDKHPENDGPLPPEMRGDVIGRLEADRFKKSLA